MFETNSQIPLLKLWQLFLKYINNTLLVDSGLKSFPSPPKLIQTLAPPAGPYTTASFDNDHQSEFV